MAKIVISPSKYVQGNGELKKIYDHIGNLGKSFLFIVSKSGFKRTGDVIKKSFKNTNSQITFEIFNGECSHNEIQRLKKVFAENHCDVVVGVGGGKILDTAKAVSYYEKSPVVIVPTIASTDAPCSALSVIYTEDGIFSEYIFLPKNPDIVLMDTEIISKAPARLLVAGMGDALATFFEARACARANANNMSGGKITKAALALATLCYETLMEDGLKAKLAVEKKVCTKAVENIVEANTYLSGIGFESAGLAAAHAIHNGFTVLEECHHLYHGEKVAFGTIVQLILENSPMEEIQEVLDFCIKLGLPVTLKQLGINEINEEKLMEVSKISCAEGETIYNMPFEVTSNDVYAAILAADSLGQSLS
ncbi:MULTISPECIES: glycerol dehydrogenase [Clostridium]|uniref:Glycerol dehydrogenase n=1 Tax=Clostridium novyi (strain NT) TaxID=386415 RepID=A0Q2D3_CLONN|nr:MULTISPECIES: glycerol dehydrogenase [Clostridium]ABK61323.1 glycerol dehydrogenase CgrD [Clostridium novyi NT]KEH85872.1 glycerol dehydrogenase [Clostridium novyi A str. NCTC 538]KEH86960.1 glycerol dehydrogenase [Clostridium novyi A str. 4540]KEH88751.1 glycerol dehydrogenase [Clostridium novyi A str. BKT29909]KEH92667.1 glycerol dehydrogenase [Clostridium botulinum C/D str. It1]